MSAGLAGGRVAGGILIGFSPGLLAFLAAHIGFLGGFLLLPAGVLLIANSFLGAFTVADRVTNAPWKNLALGLALAAIFLVANAAIFGALMPLSGPED